MNYYKSGRLNNAAPHDFGDNYNDAEEDEYFGNAKKGQFAPQPPNSLNLNNDDSAKASGNSCSLEMQTGVPLAVCQVVYLGACSPEPGTSGLQAVQKPLTELYREKLPVQTNADGFNNSVPSFISSIIKGGCEATLAVYSFGLKLIYLPDQESPSVNIWFPISNLFVCAAVRYVKSLPSNRRFVPLDLAEADESDEAPLFAAIFRQSRARHVTECFCFVCKSKQNAMDLVLACTNAFETFVRNRPSQSTTSGYMSGSRKNVNSAQGFAAPGGSKGANHDDDGESSGMDEPKDEEWQPVLVRRLWFPAPNVATIPPQVYYNNAAPRARLSKKIMARKMNLYGRNSKRQLLERYLYAQQMAPAYNGKVAPAHASGSLLRWPSADALSTSANDGFKTGSLCHYFRQPRTNKKAKANQPKQALSSSSLSLYGGSSYKDVETLKQILRYNDSQTSNVQTAKPSTSRDGLRQWSSQPTLDVSDTLEGRVSRWPGDSQKGAGGKKSFINKLRRFFSTSNKHSQAASPGDSHRRQINQQNSMIDYATIASDEADLLRVQTDCYGNGVGTLTKHPLPNEKAFMISIRNQQHCSVAKNGSSAAATRKTSVKRDPAETTMTAEIQTKCQSKKLGNASWATKVGSCQHQAVRNDYKLPNGNNPQRQLLKQSKPVLSPPSYCNTQVPFPRHTANK